MFSLEDLGKIQEIMAQFSPGSHNDGNKEAKGSKKNHSKERKE